MHFSPSDIISTLIINKTYYAIILHQSNYPLRFSLRHSDFASDNCFSLFIRLTVYLIDYILRISVNDLLVSDVDIP